MKIAEFLKKFDDDVKKIDDDELLTKVMSDVAIYFYLDEDCNISKEDTGIQVHVRYFKPYKQ